MLNKLDKKWRISLLVIVILILLGGITLSVAGLIKKDKFVGDINYNVSEDLNMPKVVFVYSDPTPHHLQG